MGVREIKQEIRTRILKERALISEEEKKRLDRLLSERFFNLLSFKYASSVILYASLKHEPDTYNIILEALKKGKRVALPRCAADETRMDFFEIKSLDDLISGSYGIMEPDPYKCKKINPYSYDIAVVPALAFDSKGYRIGYGKGYYDRFLGDFKGTKIGLTYERLIEKNLPRGRYDKRVDIVITERGVNMVADS